MGNLNEPNYNVTFEYQLDTVFLFCCLFSMLLLLYFHLTTGPQLWDIWNNNTEKSISEQEQTLQEASHLCY